MGKFEVEYLGTWPSCPSWACPFCRKGFDRLMELGSHLMEHLPQRKESAELRGKAGWYQPAPAYSPTVNCWCGQLWTIKSGHNLERFAEHVLQSADLHVQAVLLEQLGS